MPVKNTKDLPAYRTGTTGLEPGDYALLVEGVFAWQGDHNLVFALFYVCGELILAHSAILIQHRR